MASALNIPNSYIESLKHKHQQLEEEIHKEELRPSPVGEYLKRMKIQKLHIKDQIQNALSRLRQKAKT